ncbi:single-stranded DNA-binding protein [Actinocorallia longicatena]|uniref:Single-stranded DNA-binding protein n=1 Tax=Actinocorallia longicatena TaxID=111803 RepID=A0ABP6QMW2_9ACTN
MNDPYFNEVLLCGRLAGEVSTRPAVIDSAALEWRLTVDRPGGTPVVSETFPCVTHDPDLAIAATAWRPGALIEIRGALRRTIWTSSDGSRLSRVYIETDEAELLDTPPLPATDPPEALFRPPF